MFKKIITTFGLALLAMTILVGSAQKAEATDFFSAWGYLKATALVHQNVAITIQPGGRFRMWNSAGTVASNTVSLTEVFAGAAYVNKWGGLKLAVPVMYYYLYIPSITTHQHAIELMPTVSYTFGKFTIANRIILHNVIAAHDVATGNVTYGYDLTIRELIKFSFAITPKISLGLGQEFWFNPVDTIAGSTTAYSRNRVYFGPSFKLAKGLGLTVNYVWQADLNADVTIKNNEHYILAVLSIAIKTF